MTNHGERLGLYDFGANLRELSFESGQDDFDSQAVIRIKTTVNKYMPFVNLSTFESKPTPNKAGNIDRVDIKITYNVPRLGVRQRELIATIFVRG
jgi:phage baseplate assembly protein W